MAKKRTRQERIGLTIALENILETHCRPCTREGKDNQSVCEAKCSIYPEIRKIGKRLEEDTKRFNEELLTDEVFAMAKRNGVSKSTVTNRIRNGVPVEVAVKRDVGRLVAWTAPEDKLLLELKAEKLRLSEIAEQLKRPVSSIASRYTLLQKRI